MAEADKLDADGIWQAWRQVVRIMSVRSLLVEFVFSRSVYNQWGADYVSGLRRNRSTRKVMDFVRTLAPSDARRLHAIALINHRRLEAISRWTAVGAVTVPASGLLMMAQLAPERLAQVEWDLRDAILIGASLAGLGWVLTAAWRARQIVTVIELAFVERDLPLQAGGDGEAEESPISQPLGA